jgi:transposase
MHIDDLTYKRGKKIYRRVLLRDSYREGKRVLHHTIANLSKCSEAEIAAIKLAMKYKTNLGDLLNNQKGIETEQGLSVGAVLLIDQVLRRLGIKSALGNSRKSKLIQWLIMATLIEQGSRLSATRIAQKHAACDVLGIQENFCENTLYNAMDWLNESQNAIEERLFKLRYKNKKPTLYLYDVTSSYFEGQHNELAEYGYNRDKKKGKMQIVIGLMTDGKGNPIAVEVFKGNTNDTKTFASQIKKISNRFNVERVTFVGDRGMIKSAQIKDLSDENFSYTQSE